MACGLQLEAEVSVALLALMETNPKAVRAILDALDQICAQESTDLPEVTPFGASSQVFRLVTHGYRVLFEVEVSQLRAYHLSPTKA